MNIILMEHETDCEVAAIATACQVSYDDAETALGWRKLPLGAENPIFGNSLNLHKALLKLGFWKRNINLSQLFSGNAKPGKTVVLLKQSLIKQHWVVFAGLDGDNAGFYWGDQAEPRWFPQATISKWFYMDGPVNEAFEVYKASFWKLVIERIKSWFS